MSKDIQLNVDLAIAKALDSNKVPGFTTKRWKKAILSHVQVGNTTQTWLHVAAYEGPFVDVTQHLTGDLDVLPKKETWDKLKKEKYKEPRPHPIGDDPVEFGGSWFAVKSEIEGSRGENWTYEFDKQVWAGGHQDAPFTAPPSSTKDVKPSADDWGREFGLYPRLELPAWAQPIVSPVPATVRAITPLVWVPPIYSDWSSLRTVVESERLLWLRLTTDKFISNVTKALGEGFGVKVFGPDIYFLHAKGDQSKGFGIQNYALFDFNHGILEWSWAGDAERSRRVPTRDLFEYGVKNNILDLTYPSHALDRNNRDEGHTIVAAFASVIVNGVFNAKLSLDEPGTTDEVLRPYRLLTKAEATPLFQGVDVPKTYVDVDLPTVTFDDVYNGIERALGFNEREQTDKFSITDIVKNVAFLATKTNIPIEASDKEATLTPPGTTAESATKILYFEQTDRGFSFSRSRPFGR